MHQPRPHGQFGAASEEDAAAAELLARRLSNFKTVSGLSSLKLARTLPSGAMAIAIDAGGVQRVIIQQPEQVKPQVFVSDGLAKNFVPMFFSGMVTSGRVRHGQPASLRITKMTRRRLSGYKHMNVPEYIKLMRFVVEIPQQLKEFEPKFGSENFVTTQYASCRPTWWSGAMAQLVQVVGGYGIQERDKLPDDPIELARMEVPARIKPLIDEELNNTRLPGYTGFPPKDGRLQFDYKFNRTHGVGFDSSNRPWLLRVSPAGVYAMPLPLIPATTTGAFKAYVQEQGDDELQWVIDRFGGLPSGEGFPKDSRDFEAWRRAGVIIKVCGPGDFYNHFMYSTALGWSFNERGTEGVNTCYTVDDGTGITYGLAFKLSLRLQPARDDGKLPDKFHLADSQEQHVLNAYLSGLYSRLGGENHENLAIKYKLRRVEVSELLERARSTMGRPNVMQAELEYWANLEMEPIAGHSGSITQFARGALPWRIPEFKYPEPFMEGCISFESMDRPRGGASLPRCDTIVTAYYTGNTLKVLKYFKDDRKYMRAVESNYEACMTVGSWEKVETRGQTGLMGNLYSTDFDDRDTVSDTEVRTNIVGVDRGFDHTPYFSFDAFFWKPGTLWRNRYFTHETTTEETASRRFSMAMCMPWFDRNAVLYAQRESHAGKRHGKSLRLYSIADPTSYRYWTYDFIWHWAGGVSGPQAAVPVYPKDSNPVWVVQENYNPGPCSDFADYGSWIALPADYTWLIHPEAGVYHFAGGGGPPKIKEYGTSSQEPSSSKALLQWQTLEQPITVHDQPDPWYWAPSPDDFGNVFYRDAIKVVAGYTEYASVSEKNVRRPGERFFQGWCRIADNKSAHHFIGVINE